MQLLDEGRTCAEIGAALELSENGVHQRLCRKGVRPVLPRVTIGRQARRTLAAEAISRGLTPSALASRILAAVLAKDEQARNMVAAVLDDHPHTEQPKERACA